VFVVVRMKDYFGERDAALKKPKKEEELLFPKMAGKLRDVHFEHKDVWMPFKRDVPCLDINVPPSKAPSIQPSQPLAFNHLHHAKAQILNRSLIFILRRRTARGSWRLTA